MSDIFIGYAREDRDKAKTRADHSVFCISDFDQIYDEAIKPAN